MTSQTVFKTDLDYKKFITRIAKKHRGQCYSVLKSPSCPPVSHSDSISHDEALIAISCIKAMEVWTANPPLLPALPKSLGEMKQKAVKEVAMGIYTAIKDKDLPLGVVCKFFNHTVKYIDDI